MKRIYIYILGVFAVSLLPMFGFSWLTNYLTFHPKKHPDVSWDSSAYSRPVEDHWITASDKTRLHAWYIPRQGVSTAVLWLHGNAGNISGRVDQAITWADNLPVSLLLLSYRGYGKSEGSPSETGVYLDAEAGYNHLSKQEGISSIIIYGQSLGGAIAIELATRTQSAGLVVEGSFTSTIEIGKIFYPYLPVKWIAGDPFNSLSKIDKIDCPKLFVHGDQDEVVPFEMGKRLFEKAKAPKTFYHVKGGDHNNLLDIGGEIYLDHLRRLLAMIKD